MKLRVTTACTLPRKGGHSSRFRLALCAGVFLTAGFLAAVSLRAEVPPAANWISNPSFEEGEDNDPVDWAFFRQHEKIKGTSDASSARSGIRGVAIKGESGLSFGRWITAYRIPLEPGTKYRVSFWYRGSGAEVYLVAQAAQMASSGDITFDLNDTIDIPVAKPAPAANWTFVDVEITSPDYAASAQLCLSGSGGESCAFDDVSLERLGLTLLSPRVPQVVPAGTDVVLKVNAPDFRAAEEGSVTWTTGPGTVLKGVAKNNADGTWDLTVTAQTDADLSVEASGGATPLKLTIPKFFRVFTPGADKLFAFAAITDAHFYRPGTNERNTIFARVASTLNALDPLFVISLGDQMENHNGQRDEEKKWICEAVKEQLGRLALPVFNLAGNHEVDRNYEGVGTRWYHEKYRGQPRNWSFRVGKTLFAGIDVTTPGVATREHGAGFLDPEQDAWFESLLSAPREAPPIIAAHISPFNEWTSRPDRDRFLSLLLGKKAGILLTGHTHYTDDLAVTNGQTAPPWPATEALTTPAQVQAALNSPGKTTILTTTTVSSFMLGTQKTQGFRYLLVKDGKIAWQAVLPSSLEVTRTEPSPGTVTFNIKAGADMGVIGLPLRAKFQGPETVSAQVGGNTVPCTTERLADGATLAFAQADVAAGATVSATFTYIDNFATTIPAAPRVTVDSATSVTLSWADNFVSNTSYRARFSTDGLNWTTFDAGADATSFTFTGLVPGTAYQFQVRAEKSTAPAQTGLWSGALTATPSAANSWVRQHFGSNEPSGISAWNADPDGDGMSNLMEYALGYGPTDSSDCSWPTAGRSGSRLSLTFTPEVVSGLTYIVEASSDLSKWSPINITGNLTPGAEYTHTDAAVSGQRFLRLKVTSP